jgi:Uncharacterized conserved protein (COG2071)
LISTARLQIEENLRRRPHGALTISTRLRHFALINYAVPVEKLTPWIPEDFEIETFEDQEHRFGLISVVPFVDEDFRFINILPNAKFTFAQTNHRIYVRHRSTNRKAVWFFGTTLGSRLVAFPRMLWKLPWHSAKYRTNFDYDATAKKYKLFEFTIDSRWCGGHINLEDVGTPVPLLRGFKDYDEMKLILTHPIDGYYFRRDGKVGSYSIWHEEMHFTQAKPRALYFELYERLKIMSRSEMESPHSVLICPNAEFRIQLPPTVVAHSKTQFLKGND